MAIRLDRTEIVASDLDDVADDGRRWELIDGVLHVTPAPSGPHQVVVANLLAVLRAARPVGVTVLPAPFDYRPDEETNLQPDLLVVDAAVASLPRAVDAPHLVVEVLSPRTRADDLGSKRLTYERLGVPVYWVVDPSERTLTVLAVDAAGAYGSATTHGPGGTVHLVRPFTVAVDLDMLLAP